MVPATRCWMDAFRRQIVSFPGFSVTQTYSYDGFGRIATSTQNTPGYGYGPFPFSYGYSLTDQLTSVTYPTGRQVNYTLDAADPLDVAAEARLLIAAP